MVATAEQADSVFFNAESGCVLGLPQNATILLCSTVPAAFLDEVRSKLDNMSRSDISLVDCPVSGGTARAAEGTLTILAAGTNEALSKADQLLRDMSEKLYRIPGSIGAASNVKMINQLLVGTHIAAASEAMGLAALAGLNTREVYDIIVNAAGNSWAFENRVPHMLNNEWTPLSALNIFVKDMGIVTSSARKLGFPVPLASAAEQLWLSGANAGYGRDDDAGLVRMFLSPEKKALVAEKAQLTQEIELTPVSTPKEIEQVGFIGLGAMGSGMASSLIKAGMRVKGYDAYGPSIERFTNAGELAIPAASPADAAKNSHVLILMVQNAKQAEDVLFGSGNAAGALPSGATVILSSTVPPSFTRALSDKLAAVGRDFSLIDAPVSGGVARAASGQLTIICSGSDAAFQNVTPAINAMAGTPKNICRVQGGVGAASSVKLINQLLAGVHIAAAAEAMVAEPHYCIEIYVY